MKGIIVFFCILVSALQVYGQTSAQRTIVVIAPHPDDGEASCGGLIANSTAAGDRAVILTMTGGELGIWGKSQEEARAIRAREAHNAAGVLGAQVELFGAIDGSLAVDKASTDRLIRILLRLKPDIVLAPWPLDVHSDHQASGLLAWRVFQNRQFGFDLYFYETSNSPHTKSFQFVPTDYVDITDVIKKKQVALYQQKSQGPADWWGMYEHMAIVNGYSADVTYAEAYIKARTFSGMGGRPGVVDKTLSGRVLFKDAQ
ncbi:MAG: PIG-L family deacetylase [Candidatus Wallbacteria bacterium]|nr:PIG-L family deacetylase [Candidatus Wallbacteria bacterium]